MSRPLRTFNVADVRCCNQTFNLATVSVPDSKRSLRPRLYSQVRTIMFMHTAMIFIILPQLFCRASNFSRYYFFLVKFKTMGLVEGNYRGTIIPTLNWSPTKQLLWVRRWNSWDMHLCPCITVTISGATRTVLMLLTNKVELPNWLVWEHFQLQEASPNIHFLMSQLGNFFNSSGYCPEQWCHMRVCLSQSSQSLIVSS